jgi:hypothetical protein
MNSTFPSRYQEQGHPVMANSSSHQEVMLTATPGEFNKRYKSELSRSMLLPKLDRPT